jgi:hypothetical protein
VTWWAAPLPWLLPVCLLALVVSTLASDRVARRLQTRRATAWLLLMSLGIILAATLTPLAEPRLDPALPGTCDWSRIGPPSVRQLLRFDDVLGNVVMFLPFGFAIGLLPSSAGKAAVFAAGVASPFVIELTQLVVTPLGRACESRDVVDNLLGLLIGAGIGLVAARLAPTVARGAEPTP